MQKRLSRFLSILCQILLVGVLLSSCASTKKNNSSSLTYKQKIQFDVIYFEAAKLKAIGDYTNAANQFAAALKIDPKNHAVMYQLANLNIGVRNFHDAIYWGEKSIKANPNYNFWYYGQLAQAYNKVSDYKKSAEVFKKMINKEPNRKSNYLEAGNQYINAHEFKSAIAIFNSYEKKFGVEEESARKKEGIYYELGKPNEAIQSMESLVEAFPNNSRFKGLLAETYTRNKQYQNAISTYQEILKAEPENGYAFFGLADVYRKLGESDASFKNLLKAFDDKNMSLELKIKVIGSYYVYIQKDEKMQSQALQLCEKLVKIHPTDASAFVAYGDVLYASGKVKETRDNLLIATEIDASNINVWQKLLSLDDELDNFQYLESDSKNALEFFPNHTFLYIINSFANYTLKNFKKAQKVASEGLEISLINIDRIDLLITLADASNELGEFDKSDAAFEELLELDPANSNALNNYAYYLSVRKVNLDKALAMIQKALKISPNELTYKDTYGWILFQQGEYDRALKILEEVYKEMNSDPEVMEHYAYALIKTGKTDEGEILLTKAKALKQNKNQ